MRHTARAEYAAARSTGEGHGPVKSWHMVRGGESVAMCGLELERDAESRSEDVWGATEEPFCHTCGALYLREVP